jgi:outer membrane protein assembly factor BamB
LFAYDAASGTQLWSTALTSQYWFTDPPTAANGFVYVGGTGIGGTLYAVDETTGVLTWTRPVMNGDNSSPTVTADGVYVSYPCQTYDFRPLTGELVWNNSTGCEGGGGATGLAANGVVYSPNSTSGVSGMTFNAETGTFLSGYAASALPAVGSQMGYFPQGGTLNGITVPGGVIQWSFAGDGTLMLAPVLVNNYVFVAALSGNLYALDAATGSQLWNYKLGAPMTIGSNANSTIPATGLSAGGGLLVVAVGNKLTAFTLSTNP